MSVKKAIRCPRCRSCQLVASRRRLTLSKPGHEIIASGVIYSRAELYPYVGIHLSCQTCQHRWNSTHQRVVRHETTLARNRRWKAEFYRAVEANDAGQASHILAHQQEHQANQVGVLETYDVLKKADREELFFIIALFIISIGMIMGLGFLFIL